MKKKILIIGGHDPSGGAGVMMDAYICRLNECHPLTLINVSRPANILSLGAVLGRSWRSWACLLYTSDAADE